MAKPKEMGVCPMCDYGGDATPKALVSSHVIPKNSFNSLHSRIGEKLKKNRHIEMSPWPDSSLDVVQNPGAKPMLCCNCEQRLGSEIENPTRKWIKKQTSGPSIDADSVLLARYAALVWWRAMLSKHRYFQHVLLDRTIIPPLMEASLDPSATYKNVSFRLRKLVDGSGDICELALSQYMATISGPLLDEGFVQGHACFAVIHDRLVWEIFSPRLSHSKIKKLNCFSPDRKKYILRPLDFCTTPPLVTHATQNYSKYVRGKITPAFGRVYPPSDG